MATNMSTTSSISAESPKLITLPDDIIFEIFDLLDPVASTCLGLTSRVFYPEHRRRHGTIGLLTTPNGVLVDSTHRLISFNLSFLLFDWMGPKLKFDCKTRKFLTVGQKEGRENRNQAADIAAFRAHKESVVTSPTAPEGAGQSAGTTS